MVHVVVTTAIKMASDELAAIKKAIEQKYGRDVEYQLEVDPHILGGIKLQIDSRLLDGSIENKVSQLERNLVR